MKHLEFYFVIVSHLDDLVHFKGNQAKYAIWLDNDGKPRNYFPIMQAVPQEVNAVGDADIVRLHNVTD